MTVNAPDHHPVLSVAPLTDGRRRVQIEGIHPEVDGGRFPIKRVVGEPVDVEVDLFADGHDVLAGVLMHRREGASGWQETPLQPLGNDRWQASFAPLELGRHEYTIEGWVDAIGTWAARFRKKADARQDLELELRTGSELLRAAAARARDGASSRGRNGAPVPSEDVTLLEGVAARLVATSTDVDDRIRLALDEALLTAARRWPDRRDATRHGDPLPLVADPPLGRTSAWYEMFPRSFGTTPGRHGTFAEAERMLPYVASLGFDILYLPPIHPIGRAFRKGRNNSLVAEPGDPGSPWAIGAAEGGHTAVHPELGTLEDFERFVRAAKDEGLAVALDIAFQASPDHPWVEDHPSWFRHRADGTIQYAENPPKKYQDIYPLDFESADWRGLWNELRGVFAFWAERGVRVFRVDNPHTKSLSFWHWCIASLKKDYPDIVLLSEAFTRPRLMYGLAKRGFTQSYTYFTWRSTAAELRAYVEELAHTEVVEYFRPSFWPNTPDILPPYLQRGLRATFVQRAVLASTLSPSWGIYGPAFELMESEPRPGVEEYIDNEKYEIKSWDLERQDSLAPLIRRLNEIRRAHPALHELRNIVFHETDNPAFLCFSKRTANGDDTVLVLVSTDDTWSQSGWTDLNLEALGIAPEAEFEVHDLLADARYRWRGARNFVELHPAALPAHVFLVNPGSLPRG